MECLHEIKLKLATSVAFSHRQTLLYFNFCVALMLVANNGQQQFDMCMKNALRYRNKTCSMARLGSAKMSKTRFLSRCENERKTRGENNNIVKKREIVSFAASDTWIKIRIVEREWKQKPTQKKCERQQ